jgi:hypothetical protein
VTISSKEKPIAHLAVCRFASMPAAAVDRWPACRRTRARRRRRSGLRDCRLRRDRALAARLGRSRLYQRRQLMTTSSNTSPVCQNAAAHLMCRLYGVKML